MGFAVCIYVHNMRSVFKELNIEMTQVFCIPLCGLHFVIVSSRLECEDDGVSFNRFLSVSLLGMHICIVQ